MGACTVATFHQLSCTQVTHKYSMALCFDLGGCCKPSAWSLQGRFTSNTVVGPWGREPAIYEAVATTSSHSCHFKLELEVHQWADELIF